MRKIVDYTLKERKDVFFYWMVPDWATEEDMAWYPKHENIRFIKYAYSKDRMREFMRVLKEYEDLVAFSGQFWDADIIVTNRTSLIPFIKVMANKPSRGSLAWAKKIFLIEDMPIMGFKTKLGIANPRAQSIQTCAGYLNADLTCISAFWEKAKIMNEMKTHFSPSAINYVDKTMIESSAAFVTKTGLKTKASIQAMLDGTRPFTIGFVGRMIHSNQAEEIFDIMGRQWIMHSGKKDQKKIRCVASTQSASDGRVRTPSWMEVHRLPREGFWKLIEEEVDVTMFMSPEEDYSMSLMEPLLLGCPAVLQKAEWAIPSVGATYPFYVNGVKEAYGMVRMFYDNYVPLYEKFAKWSRADFQPMMLERNKVYVPKVFSDFLPTWESDFKNWVKSDPKALTNEIVQLIANWHKGKKGDLSILGAIEALGKDGTLTRLAEKLNDNFNDRVRLGWLTDWNYFRLALIGKYGYHDASTEVGVLRRG